jgi:3-dehydrosphinganine reductase
MRYYYIVGMIGFAGYSPSKFAVRGLAESLQMELRPFNIYTSLINPPDVDTPMLKEESAFKPEECRIISEGGGLFSADDLAADIIGAVDNWRFMVNTGFDGYLLGLSSAGISCPSHSTFNTFVEIFFAGFLRFVGLAYLSYWNSVCTKFHKKKTAINEKGTDSGIDEALSSGNKSV